MMSVHAPAAYGMYSQEAPLNEVVRTLNEGGFRSEDICLMLAPTHPLARVVREASFLDEREASAVNAGLIGWLSGFGAVVIPTVGFFIRSQLFFQALMVSKESSAICGNFSGLAGLGFSTKDAQWCDSQLRKLGVMVYVSCPETARTSWATELMRRTGAREAATLEHAIAMEAVA